jgi:protocatechuate 3,4-dioxygenase beta subunit
MKYFLLTTMLVSAFISGCTQHPANRKQEYPVKIGGGCEGCEAIYECPVSFEKLGSTISLPDFVEKGPRLEISGTVFQADGKTPAVGVVIYVYHTDQTGHYTARNNESGWGKRHGTLRGWMKTDARGFYRFYTLMPAAYPGRKDPAHIHVTIKEPDKNEYWIDEYVFESDPLLTQEEKNKAENRGGSGIVRLSDSNGKLHGVRNIYLGRNIPGYR